MQLRPHQVYAHQPGQHHSKEYGENCQEIILLADRLMIQTEDVLADKTLRRGVMMRGFQGHFRHCYFLPGSECSTAVSRRLIIGRWPAAPSTSGNHLGT